MKALGCSFLQLGCLNLDLPHLLQCGPQHRQPAGDLLQLQRLEHIRLGPDIHGITDELKLVIAADDQDLQMRIKLLGPGHQLNSIHPGHRDIGNEHIHHRFTQSLQRFLPGFSGNRRTVPQLLPFNITDKPLDVRRLVIDNQYAQHAAAPSPISVVRNRPGTGW
ncbi:hypothetical protein D3C75_579570 [compost metagenome]